MEEAKPRIGARFQKTFVTVRAAVLRLSLRYAALIVTFGYLLLVGLYAVQAVAATKTYAIALYAIGSGLYLLIAVCHGFAESDLHGHFDVLAQDVDDALKRLDALEARGGQRGSTGTGALQFTSARQRR